MSALNFFGKKASLVCLAAAGCLLTTGCVHTDGAPFGSFVSFVRDFLLNVVAAWLL